MRAVRSLRLAWGLMLLSVACGDAIESAKSPLATGRSAIVGGIPTRSDSDVFMLFLHGDNGEDSLCTATLIAPRTLLTAAHCVDPSTLGAQHVLITATNAATESEVRWGANTVPVIETRTHPLWNPGANLEADIAVALLEVPQTVTPRPWNAQSLAGMGGKGVRAVGYGALSIDAGAGVRRTVDLSIRQLSSQLISLGNLVDKGICHGDSGGPTFHTFEDNVERLIGIHSFTRTEDCLDGADTRVDAFAPFVLQWLSEKEETCGPNLVCSSSPCSSPDPDCVALGEACHHLFECAGRMCVADAQHPETYCSKLCLADAECGSGLRCDLTHHWCQRAQLPLVQPGELCVPNATFCTSGAQCETVDAEQHRCAMPCEYDGECPEGQHCRMGSLGNAVCLTLSPVQVPLAEVKAPVASSCSALGFWPMWALAGLLIWRGRFTNELRSRR